MGVFQRGRAWLVAHRRRIGLVAVGAMLVAGAYLAFQVLRVAWAVRDLRNQAFVQWAGGDMETRKGLVTAQGEACPGAPFILPAEGFIGLLYGDPRGPYSVARPHQGIDIFSLGGPGETPVYAAYDGYVTREADWRSSVIIRVPEDPLMPGRQIWLYYTHMADRSGEQSYIADDFPPGTYEKFVRQGTLLGHTGDYNGNSLRGVWVHLHFSIVLDDGRGHYLNELDFDNTVDPSRYLGMAVNVNCAADVPECTADPLCGEAVLGNGGG
jgi:murein DD-endopeptidase MepM/ murein hydrolase activator NlpD